MGDEGVEGDEVDEGFFKKQIAPRRALTRSPSLTAAVGEGWGEGLGEGDRGGEEENNFKNMLANLYTQYLNQTVTVKIDRPLGSLHPKYGFVYEVNYGFVPDTKAPDGEEIDVYVLGVTETLQDFTGRCIAVIHRTNDDDDKLIVVPEGNKVSDDDIRQLTNFQEKFFKSEIVRK